MLNRIHTKLTRAPKSFIILLFLVLNFINVQLFARIAEKFTDKPLNFGFTDINNKSEIFWIIVVATPLIETIIFQYAVIESFRKKWNPIIVCFISALLFGSIHFYNIIYLLYAFIAGLMLAYIYYLGKTSIKGFIITLIAHLLFNGLTFIISSINE